MNIKYKLTFYSEWHCGSGLSAGADVDALVVKDRNGLPYVPGKTIKGLIREAVENMIVFRKREEQERTLFVDTFGNTEHAAWNMLAEEETDKTRKGKAFFSNAELELSSRKLIQKESLQSYLYRSVSSTAIDEKGVAKEHSLRSIETVIPCELTGWILEIPDDFSDRIREGLRFVKQLGLSRNRGLGRCEFIIEKEVKP